MGNIELGFVSYLRSQKRLIIIALAISGFLYALFRYLYPLPDMYVDSSNYILWASFRFSVAYRPLGYSVFLQLAHTLCSAWFFTVSVQYLLFLFSSLFCFFSADHLFGLPQKLKLPVLLVVIVNPILYFQANLISSDSLFCSLTIAWLTSCLWIIGRQNWLMLILQVLLLYLCLEVRYTALFYPAIALVVFASCAAQWQYKVAGIVISLAVIALAVQAQISVTEKETGAHVFSGFAGWQVANNALYCYPYIDIKSDDLPTQETRIIDHFVKINIDSVATGGDIGFAYLWDQRSPLKKYARLCAFRQHTDYLVSWFNASVPLGDYGWYVIRYYPAAFIRYYIWPNTLNYFYPPAEVLANYDYKNMAIPPETKQWFGMNEDHLDCRLPMLQGAVISFYPVLTLLLHVLVLFSMAVFAIRALPVWQGVPGSLKSLFLAWSAFYIAYMGFSIFASSINLRFLDYLFVAGVIFPCLLLKKLPARAMH